VVTSGVSLPRDMNIYFPDELALFDAAGNAIPCQKKATARWGGPHKIPHAR
jgi:hypothetical protein